MFRAVCVAAGFVLLAVGSSCANEADRPPEFVALESPLLANPNPIKLPGALRRPEGNGPFGAVVLLHSCNGNWLRIDDRWSKMIAAWGYVALSVDSFGPRGITSTCGEQWPSDMVYDAYRGLSFLVRQPYVDPSRVAALGFSRGGRVTLLSVEDGFIERMFADKFRAAVAFYPACGAFSGRMTVPTLILIGEADDWTRADNCRDMIAGRSAPGITRSADNTRNVRLIVYPDAHHAFDVASLQPGRTLFGHRLEYNKAAADQATRELRLFLDANIGR
jgi:dienelactone hydrolase